MGKQQLVLASGNQGKLTEFSQGLSSLGIDVIPQSQFTGVEAVETGLSFVENAIIKARHACAASGLPALADDSGLEVDALLGKPGIYSSRFSGQNAPHKDAANNAKLLAQLQGVPTAQRNARFQCVLVYMRHDKDPVPLIYQGTWEGYILTQAQGEQGFGYDPLFAVKEFTVNGTDKSVAQLSKDEKMALSHRGQAIAKLLAQLPQDLDL